VPIERSKVILSILMLVSVLTVLTAMAGWLPEDGTAFELGLIGPSAGKPGDQGEMAQDGSLPSGPDQTAGPADQAANGTLAELAVADLPAADDPAGQLDSWPEASTLARIRAVDRTAWQGRANDPKPLAGVTVFLDPGHGGHDTGALYPAHSSDPVAVEAAINLAVARKTQAALEAYGATVVLIREADVWQSIFYRIAWTGRYLAERFLSDLAAAGYQSQQIRDLIPRLEQVMAINSDSDESGGRGLMSGEGASADLRLLLDLEAQFEDMLFLSIHCNALDDDASVSGLQVFYLTGATAYVRENELAMDRDLAKASPVYRMYQDESRRRLAGLVHESILEQLPSLKYQGQKSLIDENYAVLRELNLVNVLIELGFISNDHDRSLLTDPASQQQMATGIAKAVYHYYCLP